jgi:hypothetical protein
MCCNPSHLFEGTDADNHADMWMKGRGKLPPVMIGDSNPSRQHPERMARGERVCGSKLTADKVTTIRLRYANNEKLSALASEFGISVTAAYNVVKRKVWKHVA